MAALPISPKKGFFRLVAFAGIFLSVLLGVHWTINRGFRSIKYSSFGASNRIMQGQVNADIVISGSSRARSGYNPSIIEGVTHLTTFNIGRIGSQTDMQLAFLKAYLRHNAKPKLVIHNLDLFSFLTSHEVYDPAQYVPYLYDESIYAGIRRVYPDAWKWKYIPLYSYVVPDMRLVWLTGLKAFLGVQPKEDHIQGYFPRYLEWNDDFKKFREAHPKGIATEIEPQGVADLTELVELCKTQGIPLILVYAPEYFEIQSMDRSREKIFGQFREISEHYGIPLWDYSDSSLCKNRELFYNSQHLNASGADAFSKDLAERITREEQRR